MVVSYFNSTSNHNRRCASGQRTGVVSYFNSTSNHNDYLGVSSFGGLFLISILHQTTTSYRSTCCLRRCFLFQFYIKPQPGSAASIFRPRCFLFQFYIKPQQVFRCSTSACSCFLFQFYIKPQQVQKRETDKLCCFLFQFYIKPQPRICDLLIVIRLCGRMNGTNGA